MTQEPPSTLPTPRAAPSEAPSTAPSDQALLQRIAQGDEEAFRALFERYQARLYHFILRTVGESMLAEDVFQETFIRVAQNARAFQPRAKVVTWIYRIAYHLSIDALRRDKRLLDCEAIDERLPDGAGEPLDAALLGAQRSQLLGALASLSPEHRAVVLLSIVEERSHQEIADLTGVPVGTVKSRLHYALKRLHHRLSPGAASEPGRHPPAPLSP
jgi:RNA polymerase sigma-70 factor (ECF subfamily)